MNTSAASRPPHNNSGNSHNSNSNNGDGKSGQTHSKRMARLWPGVMLLAGVILLLWLWLGRGGENSKEPLPAAIAAAARLPSDVIPDHYRVELNVDPSQPRFSGRTSINVRVLKPLRRIYLHGRDLAIRSVRAEYEDGRTLSARWETLSPSGMASIVFDELIAAGFLRLVIEHDAAFSSTFEGLHSLQEGKAHYAVTQFEPSDARRVFPVFDEPGLKATFDLLLDIPAGHLAVANTSVSETTQLDGGRQRVRFKSTPRLPSYAIAFAVGPFSVIDGPAIPANGIRTHDIPLRVLTLQGQTARADFALAHTAPLLTEMENYFAIPYAFEKLDMLAIPGFSSAGLAPPGMLIYQDVILLVDEQSTPQQQHNFFVVHAHEIAHNWFGNLVTMPWWNDTWLSESFADWMAYRSLHKVWPNRGFGLETSIASSRAMRVDGYHHQHPLRQAVTRDEDIGNTYDDVTYFKGSGVMAMLEQYVGDARFQQALRNYFARHAFGTASAEDFVDAIADSMGSVDAQEAFLSFLDQPGVPLVSVTRQCRDNRLLLQLSQSRYRLKGHETFTEKSADQIWGIPLCVQTFDGRDKQCTLLRQQEQEWQLDSTCDTPVLPNAQGAGYYRWLTDRDNWHSLSARVQDMSAEQAFEMTSNISAAFRAGHVNAGTLMQYARRLAQHPNADVSLPLEYDLGFILDQIANDEQKAELRGFYQQLWPVDSAAPAAVKIGFNPDRLLTFQALTARDPGLRSRMLKQVQQSQLQKPAGMTTTAWRLALGVAVQDGKDELFQHMADAYRRETHASQRHHLLSGLAASENPAHLATLQSLILDGRLPLSERWYLLEQTLATPALQDVQWRWLRDSFDQIIKQFPDFRRAELPELASNFCSAVRANEAQFFFREKLAQLPGAESAIEQMREQILHCDALRQAQGKLNLEMPRVRP